MGELLLIGSTGFVCSSIIDSFKPFGSNLLTPTSKELDILSQSSIENYIKTHKPQVLVNFAAFTDLPTAEKDRGNQKGLAWQLNVGASRDIAAICQKHDVYLIHISTDGVYPGTPKFPGPYKESDIPPSDSTPLSWYGYTKLKGEQALKDIHGKFAIVRISHPFGNINSERDFVTKSIKYIKAGYALFPDQDFTPTYLEDLANTLNLLIKNKYTGIYHVACQNLTTPFEFCTYLASKLHLSEKVISGSVIEWSQKPDSIPRPHQGGLLTDQTRSSLGLNFHNWQKAIDLTIESLP